MLALPKHYLDIINEIDSLSLPNNNFNPYLSAPQQFQDDHNEIKTGMYAAINKAKTKIIIASLVIILFAAMAYNS
jgi:hypothetical protein